MGGSVSQVFRSGSALLSNRDGKMSLLLYSCKYDSYLRNRIYLEIFTIINEYLFICYFVLSFSGKVSEHTIDKIHTVFEILRANPKISMQTLEGLLTQIAKVR